MSAETDSEKLNDANDDNKSGSGSINSLMNGKNKSNSKKSPIKQESAPQICTWCAESKTPLKYVLPTQTGKKEFCSETCIAEFRKAYSKGACIECDNAIRSNAPNREFCSTYCLNKNKKKTSGTNQQQTPSTSTNALQNKSSINNNNNNNNLVNNNKQKTPTVEANNNNPPPIKEHYAVTKISPMFQYEAFHVFDWKEYLKVRKPKCDRLCIYLRCFRIGIIYF